MEQVLVFAMGSAIAYASMREGYMNQVGAGPDRQGLNIYRPQVTVNEPIYAPSKDKINITHAEDLSSTMREMQQRLIDQSRIESRHHTLDALRFQDQPNMGPPQDTTIPDVRDWTRPADLNGL
jgi:hypothetical protein